ncbi:SWI/SNF complex subunit SWI3B-like [Chenopodium quinoa]|uniref:SWI/SNF complex subunit SWI3B-like n=1 Tax=Chenopodium quinoa TaxID=63459 RepID=UPI000B76CC88|nr:SWI/SNF complex subunit SWI3B-like [Chenopodium quinoa]
MEVPTPTTTTAADAAITTSAPTKTDPTPPLPALETIPPPSDPKKSPDFVTVPSYSRWFKWNEIDDCEVRHMPEFFEGNSASKNPNVYKYYRNAIVSNFRSNPSKKLTFTEVRRWLVGDVGSIRRVFDFLDTWGLINYSPPSGKPPFKWEDKEKEKEKDREPAAVPSAGAATTAAGNSNIRKSNKMCSGCKVACTIACFVCDKHDLVLCARCYVRGNYQVGVNSSEFRRVEISEPVKTDWTDKETLHLLEAVMHYRDDWKRVAEHVGGRTEKECIARFIKLSFWEKFAEPAGMGEEESMSSKGQVDAESGTEPPAKKLHLSPLADASNPIMAQAAFLSALAGIEVSEATATAAVATLYNTDRLISSSKGSGQLQVHSMKVQDPAIEASGGIICTPEEARVEAESLLKQEEDEFLKSIAVIIEDKMKEIQDKIDRFEEKDLQLERERHQLQQMKHQLFIDKLTLLFNKAAASKSAENFTEEIVRTELPSSR